ncbi:rhomboid-like protein [Catenulispora pinisilvae]|uniref:rhomboid-like protein n=1 Tax=Catenulispora pinisilvae TaxID=2705253 RepID=UPI001890D1FE|nr:rhomboid-like protein [Catenulispora pinisilvae]
MSAARLRVLLPRLTRDPAFWYVVALTVAAVVEDTINPDQLRRLMDWCSTNLANIRPSGHPVAAFVASAFIPQESAGVWPFFALSLFSVVAVLGARKTVLVSAGVHVGVSVLTEGLVWWRIHHGTLPWSDERMWDTGPSYLVVTALTIAIATARPLWLRLVWALCLAGAAPSLLEGIGHGDYTAIGHVLSFSVGLVVVLRMRRASSPVGIAGDPVTVPATPQ